MTNYEIVMRDMTPEKLAELIADNGHNVCLCCAYKEEDKCGCNCLHGIEKWLKQEAKDAAD